MSPFEVEPSLAAVRALAATAPQRGNVVPLVRELPSDGETPVSVFLRVAAAAATPYSFLLESSSHGHSSRFSFVGTDPYKVVRGAPLGEGGDPLALLECEMRRFRLHDDVADQRLWSEIIAGGAVGYVAYDAVQHFEPRTAAAFAHQRDTLGVPTSIFMFVNSLVVYDHLFHKLLVVVLCRLDVADVDAAYARALARHAELLRRLSAAAPIPRVLAATDAVERSQSVANQTLDSYTEIVTRLRKEIVNGEFIQAVPSQRVARRTAVHPFDIYRHLRSVNPSPYMLYMDLGDFQIVGASPECLVRVDGDGKTTTHPIAGTRRRGATPAEDRALAAELLADPKEIAEHTMLVDLGRNDVNRVCDPTTSRIDRLMQIEYFSHVMHITSAVSGNLRDDKTPFDALRSIFPAGTVTGAPKVRAIELVAELEQERRGVYAGAAGYVSFGGTLDMAIALRTLVFRDGTAYLQAGGGVVYDSDPQAEFMETIHKMAALERVIDRVEDYYKWCHEQAASAPASSLHYAIGASRRLDIDGATVDEAWRAGALASEQYDLRIAEARRLAAQAREPDELTRRNASDAAPVVPTSTPLAERPRVLMIDNYDSFTYNVLQYLVQLGANVTVRRNDEVTLEQCDALQPEFLVVSPGPGNPSTAGISKAAIAHYAGKLPILGVCLGLQSMYEVFGGVLRNAGEMLHGKTSLVTHDGKGVFDGVPSPCKFCRYHSLCGDESTLPPVLEVTARSESGLIMGVRHRTLRIEGVQFHPESFASEHGMTLVRNFLLWRGKPAW